MRCQRIVGPRLPRIADVSALIAERLRQRVRAAGAEPLITYYELASGVRTELSAVTFANWVDKTCHLIADEHLLDPGDVVELALADENPGHWVTACWELACWQLGLTVSVDGGLPPSSGRDRTRLVERPTARVGVEVLACSLHPLGLGFASACPPAGVADYAWRCAVSPTLRAAPQSGLALAWADLTGKLIQADLIDLSWPGRPAAGPAERPVGHLPRRDCSRRWCLGDRWSSWSATTPLGSPGSRR